MHLTELLSWHPQRAEHVLIRQRWGQLSLLCHFILTVHSPSVNSKTWLCSLQSKSELTGCEKHLCRNPQGKQVSVKQLLFRKKAGLTECWKVPEAAALNLCCAQSSEKDSIRSESLPAHTYTDAFIRRNSKNPTSLSLTFNCTFEL